MERETTMKAGGELTIVGQVVLPGGAGIYTLHQASNGTYFLGEKIPDKPLCDCRHICYVRLVNMKPSLAVSDPEAIRCRKDAGVPTYDS